MATPTGTISANHVNTELGRSATATLPLSDSAVRELAGKPSGTISYNDLRGKSSLTEYTLVSGFRSEDSEGFEHVGFIEGTGNLTPRSFAKGTIDIFSCVVDNWEGDEFIKVRLVNPGTVFSQLDVACVTNPTARAILTKPYGTSNTASLSSFTIGRYESSSYDTEALWNEVGKGGRFTIKAIP